jgi:hypothetical protein
MPLTYTLIGSNSVGSGGAASITFSSIPSTYTDLVIKLSARTTYTFNYAPIDLSFNSSTTGFSAKDLFGIGATPESQNRTNRYFVISGASATSNTFGSVEIYIPNYSGSSNKTFSLDGVSEDNTTSAVKSLVAGLWSNTSSITSIGLSATGSDTFVQYTTAYLYGIKNS